MCASLLVTLRRTRVRSTDTSTSLQRELLRRGRCHLPKSRPRMGSRTLPTRRPLRKLGRTGAGPFSTPRQSQIGVWQRITTSGRYVLTYRAELRRGTTLALPLFAGSRAKGERGTNDGRDVRVLCRQGNSYGPRINCWCKQASRQEV